MKLLGNQPNGLLFVVSAPAGTGKNTLVDRLKKEFSCITESVSFTTRKARLGEENGRHYHFVSLEEFQDKVKKNEFLEHAHLFDHDYGTSKEEIQKAQDAGKHVVLVIDTQGALFLMKKVTGIFIFIAPPSLEELRRRLDVRKTENPEMIEKRLTWAKEEMKAAKHYDYLIVNEDLEIAYQVLRAIFVAEEHRIRKKGVKT
jgi:guanylate kinase